MFCSFSWSNNVDVICAICLSSESLSLVFFTRSKWFRIGLFSLMQLYFTHYPAVLVARCLNAMTMSIVAHFWRLKCVNSILNLYWYILIHTHTHTNIYSVYINIFISHVSNFIITFILFIRVFTLPFLFKWFSITSYLAHWSLPRFFNVLFYLISKFGAWHYRIVHLC